MLRADKREAHGGLSLQGWMEGGLLTPRTGQESERRKGEERGGREERKGVRVREREIRLSVLMLAGVAADAA